MDYWKSSDGFQLNLSNFIEALKEYFYFLFHLKEKSEHNNEILKDLHVNIPQVNESQRTNLLLMVSECSKLYAKI